MGMLPEKLRHNQGQRFGHERRRRIVFNLQSALPLIKNCPSSFGSTLAKASCRRTRSPQRTGVTNLSDAQETIMAAPWLESMPPELGARTFDLRARVR